MMLLHLIKKRRSHCKKVCVDHAGFRRPDPAFYALARTPVRRGFRIYAVREFLCAHAAAICLPERISIPESRSFAMRCAIFAQYDRFVQIYFLHGNLFRLLRDLWN